MTHYVAFRYDAARGAALGSLPDDGTERPAWIDLISKRLRAGQYRPVGHVYLDAGATTDLLPAVSGYLYVAFATGTVLACPGGTLHDIGNLAALLGYPNVAEAPEGAIVQFETSPEAWGVDVIVAALQRPELRGTLAGDASHGGAIEGQVAETTSILIQALENLGRLKAAEGGPVTLPMVFPAIHLKPITA